MACACSRTPRKTSGDFIVRINDTATVDDLHRFLTDWPIGNPAKVTALRLTNLTTYEVQPIEP